MAYGHHNQCGYPGAECICPNGYWAERTDEKKLIYALAQHHLFARESFDNSSFENYEKALLRTVGNNLFDQIINKSKELEP